MNRLLLTVCLGLLALGAGSALAQAPPAAEGTVIPPPAEPTPPPADADFPALKDVQLIDVPNDDGTGIGLLWRWDGAVPEDLNLQVEIQAQPDWLDKYRLSEAELQRLRTAGDKLRAELPALLAEQDRTATADQEALAAFLLARVDKAPDLAAKRLARWQAKAAASAAQKAVNKAQDRFFKATHKLAEKQLTFEALQHTLNSSADGWLATDVAGPAAELAATRGDSPSRFGLEPDEADQLFAEIRAILLSAPETFSEPNVQDGSNPYNVGPPPTLALQKGVQYPVRLVLSAGEQQEIVDLGTSRTAVNLVDKSRFNNMLIALFSAVVILAFIAAARKNPNLFIRRIAGLEAVDEAIGRATEMGKPVLYVCGMNTLADLSTLAAVNILGRVARRIADYDSQLLVPCRDPVVLSVAQETVREAFIDQGRPDAFREDNIFFVTEDQFSYTASTCAIMLRERPAANFFMGYYYAESLLLAETGAVTGAIQIAGTDSVSQLPFFITACDYTLIGEELYAASAYLSREPLLLGSLKGQDLAKAIMMVLILLQTLMFAISPELDFIKNMLTPLV